MPEFRGARVVIGSALAVLFVIAYVVVMLSYRADIDQQFVAPTPSADGVALVFAPSQVSADQRTVTGEMILFAGPGSPPPTGSSTQDSRSSCTRP